MKTVNSVALSFAMTMLALSGHAIAQAQPSGTQPSNQSSKSKGAAAPLASEESSTWAWRCSNQIKSSTGCEMTQVIVDPRNGQIQAHVTVTGASDGPGLVLVVRVPHGVYLPAGLALSVDTGAPTALQFQKSDQSGVYVALPLADKVAGELSKGKAFKLAVQVTKGQEFPIIGNLTGFGSTLDKIRK